MEWADSTLLIALQFLTPGFVAAWVLFSLTAERKLTDFQRIVQALILSALIKLFVDTLEWSSIRIGERWSIGFWSEEVQFGWSVVAALGLGLLFAHLLKTDKLYALLRKLGITTQTSRPSVWYSCFCDHPETYVVLHLRDDRSVQGWPREWPSVAGEGHIRLENAAWLSINEEGKYTAIDLPADSFLMIDSLDVRWIVFQPRTPGEFNGEEPSP